MKGFFFAHKLNTNMIIETNTTSISSSLLSRIKQASKIEYSTEDTLITGWISAAISYLEKETGKSIQARTYQETSDAFPIILDRYPVASISSIQYYDGSNNLQTLAIDKYHLLPSDNLRSRIYYPDTLPCLYDRPDSVIITYITRQDLSELVIAGISLLVSHWNANREAVIVGTIASELPLGVARIIELLRGVDYA